MLHQKRQCVCAIHIICLINYANTFCQLVLGNCQCDFSHRSTNKTVTSAESQTDLPAFERCSQQSTGSCFCCYLCCCCSCCCCCYPSATFSAGAKASGILWRIRVYVSVHVLDLWLHRPSAIRAENRIWKFNSYWRSATFCSVSCRLSLVRGKLHFVFDFSDRVYLLRL